jgi:hypothetical protein
MTKLLATLAVCVLALMAVASVAFARNDKNAVKAGAKWMAKAPLSQFPGTGFQSDAVQALAAAKRAGAPVKNSQRNRFRNAVKADANSYAQSAGSAAKVILAATGGGENPRCFGPSGQRTDFVAVLRDTYKSKSGQYGRTAFDHGLALIALRAAHVHIPSKAVKFAKSRRGKFGWGFGLVAKGGDDIESTAIMIQGLRAAGVSRKNQGLMAAMNWITYQRNTDGGYNPAVSTTPLETQADTTAYAIMAGDAMGTHKSQMRKAKRALRALQKTNGGFRNSVSSDGAQKGIQTSNAVIALSGRHFPVVQRRTTPSPCR